MKKKIYTWRNYHFIHLYHKWKSYEYRFWDMEHDRQNFLFWIIFCSFNSLTIQKIKILKLNEKITGRSFYTSVPKIILRAILSLRFGMWQMQLLFFILGYFLPFYPSNSPKNQNLKKRNKTFGNIILQVYQKIWSYAILFLRYGMWQM